MQNVCSVCQKAVPTVHVLELQQDGGIAEDKHLCSGCAESAGLIQQKLPLKISTELLEDLIGGLKPQGGKHKGPACPGCGLTATEFKMTGRLGCARCYSAFKTTLLPVLERVHDATSHRGRLPGPVVADSGDALSRLRKQLADAIHAERYEEAANLRDRLSELEKSQEHDG
jgi:protein arginine kinase activator